jgi:hypothetical protein
VHRFSLKESPSQSPNSFYGKILIIRGKSAGTFVSFMIITTDNIVCFPRKNSDRDSSRWGEKNKCLLNFILFGFILMRKKIERE